MEIPMNDVREMMTRYGEARFRNRKKKKIPKYQYKGRRFHGLTRKEWMKRKKKLAEVKKSRRRNR